MFKKLCCFICAFIVLPYFVPQSLEAASVSSLFSVGASVNIRELGTNNILASDIENDSVSQIGTINPLNVSVNVATSFGDQLLDASVTGEATWENANKGKVVWKDLGWNAQNVGNGGVAIHDFQSGISDRWTYVFIADYDGEFVLDYDLSVIASSSFFTRMSFAWDNFLFANLHPDITGTLTRPVVKGQEYRATILSQSGLGGGIGTRHSHLTAIFDWEVVEETHAVPEPATMVLFGTGLMGAVIKRKYC